MKASFFGAAKEVTGSCILIESETANFLVDCGMFQGPDNFERNWEDFKFNPKDIDFVLLTHAHLDHCGRLPKLVKQGFKGKIISTFPTRDIVELVLFDTLGILKDNPLFSRKDLEKTMRFFECFNYGDMVEEKGVKIVLKNAGHILGSAIFEVSLEGRRLVFSGDLGNESQPLLQKTDFPSKADVVFVESTYGGKTHPKREEGIKKLLESIKKIEKRKSVLLIPTFSVERSQELIYEINNFVEQKKISPVKVFLDSPLAIKVTDVFEKYEKSFNGKILNIIKSGDDIFDFENFKETEDIKDSFKIDLVEPPKIIIAGSGMCSGGRIPYFIKRHAADKNNILLLISFQAEKTLGREIEKGSKSIIIDKKKVNLNLEVEKIASFSSHADSIKLKKWTEKMSPQKVFIVHGEPEQSLALKKGLKVKEAIVPEEGVEYDL